MISLLAGRIEVGLSLGTSVDEALISSPLDTDMGIDPERRFDEWEYVLYIMTLAFLIEGESTSLVLAFANHVQRLSRCTRYTAFPFPLCQIHPG